MRHRHRENAEIGDVGGPRPKHRVYALVDGSGEVRFIGVCRMDRVPTWHLIWDFRSELPGEVASWLRTLDKPPKEITLLGSVGLHIKVAQNAARVMMGWFPNCIRRKTYKHLVAQVVDGSLTIWPSIADAARHLGVHQNTIYMKVTQGKGLFFCD